MINAEELRIGNLVIWNPKLLHPSVTLPALQVEVFAIMPGKISYVFPNIENRVEPFEDDVVQFGNGDKLLRELEPIHLTPEILKEAGFSETSLPEDKYYERGELQLKYTGEFFQRVLVTVMAKTTRQLPIRSFHQLQNLYFALTGEELETKLHGPQA